MQNNNVNLVMFLSDFSHSSSPSSISTIKLQRTSNSLQMLQTTIQKLPDIITKANTIQKRNTIKRQMFYLQLCLSREKVSRDNSIPTNLFIERYKQKETLKRCMLSTLLLLLLFIIWLPLLY